MCQAILKKSSSRIARRIARPSASSGSATASSQPLRDVAASTGPRKQRVSSARGFAALHWLPDQLILRRLLLRCPYQGEAPNPWERVKKKKIFIDADRHRPAPHHRE